LRAATVRRSEPGAATGCAAASARDSRSRAASLWAGALLPRRLPLLPVWARSQQARRGLFRTWRPPLALVAARRPMAREDRQAQDGQPWAGTGADNGDKGFGFEEYALALPQQRLQQQQAGLNTGEAATAPRKRSLDSTMARPPCEMEVDSGDAGAARSEPSTGAAQSEPSTSLKRGGFAARSGYICYCGRPAQIGCYKLCCASCCFSTYGKCQRHELQ
jgi:hypothetical protein